MNEKFRDGYGKYYLKNYAAQKFSHEHIFKKKAMPTLPIGEWMKNELHGWVRDTLARHDGSVFNTKNVLALFDEHAKGIKNHTRPLRTLLMTQVWIEQCVQSSHKQMAA